MEIKAVLFDLDGTLLPMDQDVFVRDYFKRLAAWAAPKGYEPKKLFESLWAGIEVMVKNDGSCLNREAFWKCFAGIHGEKAWEDKSYIDQFYVEEYNKIQTSCGFTEEAKKVIDLVKKSGRKVILATNPVFPTKATEHRIRWAGLSPEDFELYTTYDNSGFCKPNLQYYKEILEKIDCRAEECIMVGNDVTEDMVAEKLGMQVFLLTDCLINKEEVNILTYPNGSFEELEAFLSEKMELK